MNKVEYFYSAHSGYGYIGSALFMEIVAKAGREIDHRPMDLRRVVAATGPGPTNGATPQRRAYFSGRAIRRWAEYRGVEILDRTPTHHANGIALSNGMLIAGLMQSVNIDRLAHRMLEAHWRDDADLDDRDTLARLAREVDIDPAPLLGAALSEPARAVYEANTREAIERSVFGAPTYFVDGDMFYGQDNLELVARAMARPFSGGWPTGAITEQS